jgi:hypothetical protein
MGKIVEPGRKVGISEKAVCGGSGEVGDSKYAVTTISLVHEGKHQSVGKAFEHKGAL